MTNYELGRRACKAGQTVDQAPGEIIAQTGLQRMARLDWMRGWYDQFYGSKWEPKEAKIAARIWPIPL